ncbi:exopolysaccharide production protein ExoZ [Paraburkholderia kururiensis]|uniref:acyltransferase family protein n=1 Tax=Paraburkholderia kururiensis TaxID=984307 RepID=UPI0039A440B6
MTTIKRYKSIQVLRALAALGVVAFHTEGNVGAYGWAPRVFPHFSRYGELGVDVFFVISGFVIALVSYGEPQGFQAARKFLAARITRIVPLYWALTLLFLALLAIVPSAFGHPRLNVWHVITSFLFLPSINWSGVIAPVINVGWTLNYEAWFYVVFAAAMCITSRPLIVVATFLGITSLLRLAHGSGVPFLVYTDPIVLEFVAGCCIATYCARGKPILPGAAFVVLLGVLVLRKLYAPTLTDDNRFIVFGVPAFGIVFAALALEARIRWSSFLGKLGDASYSLYLTHVLSLPFALKVIQMADRQHRLPGDLVCLLVVACSIVAAFACYRLLERPLTRVAGRWLARPADANKVEGTIAT